MAVFTAMLLAVAVSGAKFCRPGTFNSEYLSKKNTTAVNGIFVILVVFSHYAQYADFAGAYDEPYLALRTHLNQAVVATFLFYSGYGMMEAIRKRGKAYVRMLPAKFLKLLFRFDAAVLLYLALNTVLDISFPREQTILAFTTWTAIGNSNWYITAILMLYAAMYIAFGFGLSVATGRRGRLLGITLTFALTAVAVWVQIKAGRPPYCYNTMILLPLGCLYSEFRGEVEHTVMKNDASYLVTLTAIIGIYIVSFLHRIAWGLGGYSIWVTAFMALFLLITMKISIYNKILEWFGRHVFSIYILQRMPMIALDRFGVIESHKYMSLIIVFAVTIPLALLFEKLTDAVIKGVSALMAQGSSDTGLVKH